MNFVPSCLYGNYLYPMENTAIIIALLFGISFLGILSRRYKFPFPIVLVLSGIAISLIPGLPVIELSPEVVFIIFLPPLLYGAAWSTSWHDFKANLRPIGFAAIGLVIFTSVAVAVAAHWLIPGMTWPVAFLIGAIVSPPDAVAATSVMKGLGLHPRTITVLEGESLVNDATGLIAYKYALSAIMAGNVVYWEMGLNFLMVSICGISIGLLIGIGMYLVHKKWVCDPAIEVTFTLLTPFASYLLAEQFHFSGVLAVVTTGLYLSYRSAEIFSHQSRIMAYSVWEVVMYILNGLVFVLIGLQLRNVMKGISDYPSTTLIVYGLVISIVVILVRFFAVIPAAVLPRMLSKRIREKDYFDIRQTIVMAWAGMRGVVSMAAALAIPILMPDGTAFPQRNLVIYLAFCVILVTLVLQGLTLPWLIRKLGIKPHSLAAEEYEVRNKVVSTTIAHIEEHLSLAREEILKNIKSKYEIKYNRLQKTDLPANYFGNGQKLPGTLFNELTQVQIDLIAIERRTLIEMHRNGEVSEEIIRKIERELDLEETRLQMEMAGT